MESSLDVVAASVVLCWFNNPKHKNAWLGPYLTCLVSQIGVMHIKLDEHITLTASCKEYKSEAPLEDWVGLDSFCWEVP